MKAHHSVKPNKEELVNRITRDNRYELDAKGKQTKKLIVAEDSYIDEKQAALIEKHYKKIGKDIRVKPFFTDEIEYISPEQDEKFYIADATSPTDEFNNVTVKRVAGRHFTEMEMFHYNDVTHIDVNP